MFHTCVGNQFLNLILSYLNILLPLSLFITIPGANIWNSLPQNVKDMPKLSSFKHSYKTYFLSLQEC